MHPPGTNPTQLAEPRSAPAKAHPTASSAASSSVKLRHAAWITLVLIILGSVAGLLPRWHQRDTLRAVTKELAMPTVLVVNPQPGNAPAGLSLPAEVKALVEAPIYARASGYLKHWLVDLGSKVQAGQLLAEIDTPELNQELARARAELAQTDAAVALSKTTASRWAELLKTASVSEQESAEKQADLALKSASVEAARANVRRLEEMQSFAHVTAPFAGTVTARRTDIGDLISANSGRELFRLAQTDTLRVYVRVPQTASRSIVPGLMAELTIPEIPGRTFPAKVVRNSGAIDAQSRTLLTELEVANAENAILSGSYAQVRFPEVNLSAALTLASGTLLFRPEGPQVGVVQPNGTVELRKVTLGRDFGPTIEILEGVSTSDQVIINPSDSLVSGTLVRVASSKAAPGK